MNREVPIYFDSVIVSSPFQGISSDQKNIGRLKVRVFTKYGNRNGSYITEEVAQQLIASATNGSTPVVGFFDPGTQTWASHTGPTLANAYGYVESFEGWEPFTDTDGVVRDYAVFTVILFTDYFEEAQKILGQNQSMELDINSITGDWADINGQEYYVYKTAKMLGFCIIGEHEPCFSVSSFFSKQDQNYESQYEKFALLLSELKEKVQGGEQIMDEELRQEEVVNEETPAVEFEEKQEEPVETPSEVEVVIEEPVVEEPVVTEFTEEEVEPAAESVEEVNPLQAQFEELTTKYNELQTSYTEVNASVQSLTEINNNLTNELNELKTALAQYAAEKAAAEAQRKAELVEKYERNLTNAEEISNIKQQMNNFSYDELEGKLAVLFANEKMTETDNTQKIPLVEPQETQFALMMKKYRK